MEKKGASGSHSFLSTQKGENIFRKLTDVVGDVAIYVRRIADATEQIAATEKVRLKLDEKNGVGKTGISSGKKSVVQSWPRKRKKPAEPKPRGVITFIEATIFKIRKVLSLSKFVISLIIVV